jgi:hypothetical protein
MPSDSQPANFRSICARTVENGGDKHRDYPINKGETGSVHACIVEGHCEI